MLLYVFNSLFLTILSNSIVIFCTDHRFFEQCFCLIKSENLFAYPVVSDLFYTWKYWKLYSSTRHLKLKILKPHLNFLGHLPEFMQAFLLFNVYKYLCQQQMSCCWFLWGCWFAFHLSWDSATRGGVFFSSE